MAKTIQEINEKIKAGRAVVLTAEEIIGVVREKGVESRPAAMVDVSLPDLCAHVFIGAYFNVGHATPA